MICFAKNSDIPGIVALWQEAFGDRVEDIKHFIQIYLSCILIYKHEDTVCGMLTLMPVTLNGERGKYIYAVATLKEYRSMGISTQLLEYAKNKEKFCVLVPASESLFDYYKKRGFYKLSCIEKIEYCAEKVSNNTVEFEKIDAEEYNKYRKNILGKNIVEWSIEDLENIRLMYNGDFYRLNSCNAVYFGVENGRELTIKELCCKKECIEKIMKLISQKGGYKKIHAVVKGNQPFAMIYPDIKDVYFNIALD